MRDCLRANEVYVPKGRGIVASQALADVVLEDIPWPEDDEEPPPATAAPAPAAAAPAPAAAQGYPQQQAQQQQPVQQPIVDNTTPIAQLPPIYGPNQLPPAPVYGPNHRIPHLLPSPHQIIQDFGIKQKHGHSKKPLTTSEETCIVELPSNPTDFRVTAVKPYLQESDTTTDNSTKSDEPHEQQDTSIEQDTPLEINEIRRNPSRRRQPPTRFQNLTDITIQRAYTQSRSKLARDIFILASVEIRLLMRTALRTYHKLYEIVMSDTHSRI